MFAIIMMAAMAFALAVLLNKRIHETLPVAVFTATLAVYVLALVIPLNTAAWIVLGSTLAVAAFLVITWVRGWQRGCHKANTSIFILIIICVVFCALVSGHRVFFYDDLSYWGIYTKNIFSINKLPHLFENCSVDYKDYTPIMQILQYLALFGRSEFSEGVMFQTNVCFIYIMLLPILSINEAQGQSYRFVRIASVVMYVIFPHILTAQFYYRLGVDLFLALVFGYVLYYIFLYETSEKHSELFRMIAIITALSFLALIKSSGIVLCLLTLVMFAVREAGVSPRINRRIVIGRIIITIAFTLASYFSWQLFLRYSWNNGYLSNRVKSSVTGGGLSFPPYTKEVVLNYIKHFFAYPLTRNTVGATAFVIVLFIAATYVAARSLSEENRKDRYSDTRLFTCSLIGLFIFCLAHLGMYLFVFDDWEAHGLLEFDRYITQYLGGIFFLYVCILLKNVANAGGQNGKAKNSKILLCASTVVFIALLPYADMKQYLIRSNYETVDEKYGQMSQEAQSEWDASRIAELNLAHDGTQKLDVVANAWDETTQFIEYTAVPQPIFRIINVPGMDPETVNGFIMDSVNEYVYICRNAPDSYQGDWSETAEITSDATPLKAGTLYVVDKTGDDKILREFNK